MKKCLLCLLPFILFVSGCNQNQESGVSSLTETSISENKRNMKLYIDEKEIGISWLDNPSVDALKELTPLTISLSRYGGFEQVGSIGQSIVSDDSSMVTNPGDVVLYNSSNLVIFFGSNRWSYTKLGHIDLDKEVLASLLDKENVTVTIGE